MAKKNNQNETDQEQELEFRDEFEYMSQYRLRSGLIGKVLGTIVGIGAVIGEFIGNTLRRIIFGERAASNFAKTFREYSKTIDKKNEEKNNKDQKNTKPKGKEEPTQDNTKHNNPKKDEPQKGDPKNSNKGDQPPKGRNASDPTENPRKGNTKNTPSNTKTKPHPEKNGRNQTQPDKGNPQKGTLGSKQEETSNKSNPKTVQTQSHPQQIPEPENPILKHLPFDMLVKEFGAQDVLEGLGYSVVNADDKSAFLFRKSGNQYIPYNILVPKQDLLTGQAQSLASAIYNVDKMEIEKKTNSISLPKQDRMRLSAGLKAIMVSTYVAQNINEGTLLSEGERLAHVNVTTRDGASCLEAIQGNGYSISLRYNGIDVGKFSFDKSHPMTYNQTFSSLDRSLYHVFDVQSNKTITIGSDNKKMEFIPAGHTSVTAYLTDRKNGCDNELLGDFDFKTAKGIKELQKSIASYGWDRDTGGKLNPDNLKSCIKKIDSHAIAYTIAAIRNHELPFEVTKDGKYVNPITYKTEPAGAAHFSIHHDNHGMQISEKVPVFKDGEMKWDTKPVASMHSWGGLAEGLDASEMAVQVCLAAREMKDISLIAEVSERPEPGHYDEFTPVAGDENELQRMTAEMAVMGKDGFNETLTDQELEYYDTMAKEYQEEEMEL